MGQWALACDDCDKWCHKSCLEMNTIWFDELANNSLPWYCPSCNSLNRTTVVYDLPTVDYCTHIVNSTSIQPQTPAKSDGNLTHSSTGSSGIIDSSVSLSSIEQQSSVLARNISNSEHDDSWGSLGSPAVASSPKPKPNTYRPTRNSKSLRFLCINFQSARKKGKDISALVECVQPDICGCFV